MSKPTAEQIARTTRQTNEREARQLARTMADQDRLRVLNDTVRNDEAATLQETLASDNSTRSIEGIQARATTLRLKRIEDFKAESLRIVERDRLDNNDETQYLEPVITLPNEAASQEVTAEVHQTSGHPPTQAQTASASTSQSTWRQSQPASTSSSDASGSTTSASTIDPMRPPPPPSTPAPSGSLYLGPQTPGTGRGRGRGQVPPVGSTPLLQGGRGKPSVPQPTGQRPPPPPLSAIRPRVDGIGNTSPRANPHYLGAPSSQQRQTNLDASYMPMMVPTQVAPDEILANPTGHQAEGWQSDQDRILASTQSLQDDHLQNIQKLQSQTRAAEAESEAFDLRQRARDREYHEVRLEYEQQVQLRELETARRNDYIQANQRSYQTIVDENTRKVREYQEEKAALATHHQRQYDELQNALAMDETSDSVHNAAYVTAITAPAEEGISLASQGIAPPVPAPSDLVTGEEYLDRVRALAESNPTVLPGLAEGIQAVTSQMKADYTLVSTKTVSFRQNPDETTPQQAEEREQYREQANSGFYNTPQHSLASFQEDRTRLENLPPFPRSSSTLLDANGNPDSGPNALVKVSRSGLPEWATRHNKPPVTMPQHTRHNPSGSTYLNDPHGPTNYEATQPAQTGGSGWPPRPPGGPPPNRNGGDGPPPPFGRNQEERTNRNTSGGFTHPARINGFTYPSQGNGPPQPPEDSRPVYPQTGGSGPPYPPSGGSGPPYPPSGGGGPPYPPHGGNGPPYPPSGGNGPPYPPHGGNGPPYPPPGGGGGPQPPPGGGGGGPFDLEERIRNLERSSVLQNQWNEGVGVYVGDRIDAHANQNLGLHNDTTEHFIVAATLGNRNHLSEAGEKAARNSMSSYELKGKQNTLLPQLRSVLMTLNTVITTYNLNRMGAFELLLKYCKGDFYAHVQTMYLGKHSLKDFYHSVQLSHGYSLTAHIEAEEKLEMLIRYLGKAPLQHVLIDITKLATDACSQDTYEDRAENACKKAVDYIFKYMIEFYVRDKVMDLKTKFKIAVESQKREGLITPLEPMGEAMLLIKAISGIFTYTKPVRQERLTQHYRQLGYNVPTLPAPQAQAGGVKAPEKAGAGGQLPRGVLPVTGTTPRRFAPRTPAAQVSSVEACWEDNGQRAENQEENSEDEEEQRESRSRELDVGLSYNLVLPQEEVSQTQNHWDAGFVDSITDRAQEEQNDANKIYNQGYAQGAQGAQQAPTVVQVHAINANFVKKPVLPPNAEAIVRCYNCGATDKTDHQNKALMWKECPFVKTKPTDFVRLCCMGSHALQEKCPRLGIAVPRTSTELDQPAKR